jgi:hypothetical protein
VDPSGTLASRGVQDLGLDWYDGPALRSMVADPQGRILYQRRGNVAVTASQVGPDGGLTPLAEAALPEDDAVDWDYANDTMRVVGGVLLVQGNDGLAAFALDWVHAQLRLGTFLKREAGSLLPFGAGRVIVGDGLARAYTVYQVGPTGELSAEATLPDPARYYSPSQRGTMAFLPPGRFFYSACGFAVCSFAAAPDGQLSLLQALGTPQLTLTSLAISGPGS